MYLIVAIAVGIVVSALNIACFFVGIVLGQKMHKETKIDVPKIQLNPIKAYQEKKEKEAEEEEQKKMEKLWHNIECYDGSEAGQLDL